MFYVFLVGLAKLHCGATPPSVMVLFFLALQQIQNHCIGIQTAGIDITLLSGSAESPWLSQLCSVSKVLPVCYLEYQANGALLAPHNL